MVPTVLPRRRSLAAAALCLTAACSVLAQVPSQPSGTRPAFTLRSNLPYFFIGGYHLEGAVHFPGHWSAGATVQGISELPEVGRDQFFEVSDDAIGIEWPYAVGAEVMYRLREGDLDRGFFVAGNLGYEGWRAVRNGGSDAERAFGTGFAALDVGYTWYPFPKRRFLLTAEYTAVLLLNDTDRQAVGDETFELRRVAWPRPIPNVLLGWRF